MRSTRPPLLRLGTMFLVLLAAALLHAGCLDVLTEDEEAGRIADSAASTLPMPVRSSESHWFLHQQEGWVGAHLTTYGGGANEPLTTIRVARFRDVEAAIAAFEWLTPDHTHRLWGRRMASTPQIVNFPFAFPGDQVRITEYRPPIPPDEPDPGLIVQLITIRADSVVIVIESIGVPRLQLPSVVTALVGAAGDVPR
jgi:hypothetical protein